jgi:hypothetical protein
MGDRKPMGGSSRGAVGIGKEVSTTDAELIQEKNIGKKKNHNSGR